jgi:hypothetical protein
VGRLPAASESLRATPARPEQSDMNRDGEARRRALLSETARSALRDGALCSPRRRALLSETARSALRDGALCSPRRARCDASPALRFARRVGACRPCRRMGVASMCIEAHPLCLTCASRVRAPPGCAGLEALRLGAVMQYYAPNSRPRQGQVATFRHQPRAGDHGQSSLGAAAKGRPSTTSLGPRHAALWVWLCVPSAESLGARQEATMAWCDAALTGPVPLASPGAETRQKKHPYGVCHHSRCWRVVSANIAAAGVWCLPP